MFERTLWSEEFDAWPTWPCPTCFNVTLSLLDGSLNEQETGPSKQAREATDLLEEVYLARFIAILKCHNPTCGELVSVCGSTTIDQIDYYDERCEHQTEYPNTYRPAAFSPAPPVLLLSSQCPEAIVGHLARAFALIWTDPAASANRLRAGVEALLDERRIPKFRLNNKRKRDRITLHGRIEIFQKSNTKAAEYLMAIKWLGNIGSHVDVVGFSRTHLLDGFELFGETIDLVYERRAEKTARLAAQITKRKGRPKRNRLKP